MGISGRASIDIAATPEAVFTWLIERDKQERWMGDTIEWLPSDPSQLRAGYRGTEIMQTPGRPTEAQVELTAYDPPRELAAAHEHELFRSQARFRLTGAGSGTNVESSIRIRYRSLKVWLQVMAVAPVYSRAVRGSLEQLKQLVEGAH